MPKNLVIVESPAKAKTIERFLGEDYKVMSSYGHIRDLKKKDFSIDTDTFQPQYEVPADKAHIVSQLRAASKKATTVWLASDEDREGEAISWHLQEVLKLKPEATRRIVFHEITKPAILHAIETPRSVDMGLVGAQQARRVLDRIVGFKLSPVLWRKVKPGLSAGRVQSVAVRLIVEREREVQAFTTEATYRVSAILSPQPGVTMKADLSRRFATQEEAQQFLADLHHATLTIDDIQTRPIRRTPPPPFTTSTLQQEAAHRLGLPVAQTMLVAQQLYENGLITYMRTDSVNLSTLALTAAQQAITQSMGNNYHQRRQYHTSSKGAQEAHEAIRPTYIDRQELTDAKPQERRLYELIWKRTIASQMADAQLEKTTVNISISGREEQFVATGEVVKFDGFLRVYRDHIDDTQTTTDSPEPNTTDAPTLLPPMTIGQELTPIEVSATQRYSQGPARYNEASLVRKLEELGIGRPSTYAPTISTIQQREYVLKGDKPGEERTTTTLTLQPDGTITTTQHQTIVGAERARLLPTDTGIVVNDFLLQHFPEVMDYNFTADVEKQFDTIAEGKAPWEGIIRTFWDHIMPLIDTTMQVKTQLKAGERVLGTDPATGRQLSVKIGRFGPVAQIGSADEQEKPRFAQLKKGQSIETITLQEALELFKLPRQLGTYQDDDVIIGTGRYGYYVLNNKKFTSIPPTYDPLTITLQEAIQVIQDKQKAEAQRHINHYDDQGGIDIVAGRFGPYIIHHKQNYYLTKQQQERAANLTADECLAIIREQDERPRQNTRRRAPRRRE